MDLTVIEKYKNGESLESICKEYKVGKLKLKKYLQDNDVLIRNRGGVIKTNSGLVMPKLSVEEKRGFNIIAICKTTNKEFNDYLNTSGALSRHLKSLGVPTLKSYEAKKFFNAKGYIWYEEYFNFKHVKISDTIKCPECDWETTDINNSSGALTKHLFEVHGIEKKEELSDDESVCCEICGEKVRIINNTHLKKHNITVSEYKLKYPNALIVSKNTKSKLRKLAKSNQKLFKNNFKSKAEIKIYEWVKTIYPNAISGDRKLLGGTELDIVIPNIKLAIEYNGLKYHTEWFGGKDKWYHLDKQKKCSEVGYNLIHVYEDEWELNSEIVKSKLLHLMKQSNDYKIGARKCIIKELNKETTKQFLNENHIQGYGKTTIRYGAYYNDLLVGVMTFTKRNGNGDYELSRYATKLGYNVQGLGSKLLTKFKKEVYYNTIISFADRAWTMDPLDNLYTKLGFEYSGVINPDYKYYNSSVDRLRRFHKFGFRKQILLSKYDNLNKDMTETEIVKVLGYDRIWSCGMYIYLIKH